MVIWEIKNTEGFLLIWIILGSIRYDIQLEFAIIRPSQFAEFD